MPRAARGTGTSVSRPSPPAGRCWRLRWPRSLLVRRASPSAVGQPVTGLLTASVPGRSRGSQGVLAGGDDRAGRPRGRLLPGAARRSRPCSQAVGARRPVEEREDSGFVYYGRHYRLARRAPAGAAAGACYCSTSRSCRCSPCPPTPTPGASASSASARDRALRACATPALGAGRRPGTRRRGLVRRRADHRRPGDRRHRGPLPALRRRRRARSPPGSWPWVTRGPAPTRRSAAAPRSACCTRSRLRETCSETIGPDERQAGAPVRRA